ncbi:MAG: 2-C-methyl-D-erythritol 2,4-cyclodiphosphate synthase [Deferribacteraceae bacterium]|jgi:2-C-methyl-D-erythritol 2,4-cyclodiphosphate synthase|nr:2-C-methyl-D-erythritol 2,4-cyclodiphosphate synthase [Deferribacteraceae bacterium]
MNVKTGIGFDAHAFIHGRQLIIGGADIPYDRGLDGHSDADVLTHAIIDALAGPALGKDIGNLFPDTDPSYKNADSLKLLKNTITLMREKGWATGNVDAEIIAQAPKMAQHIPLMTEKLSDAIGIPAEDISIKATTTEHLGFTGRKEGIAALAVALIYRLTGGDK